MLLKKRGLDTWSLGTERQVSTSLSHFVTKLEKMERPDQDLFVAWPAFTDYQHKHACWLATTCFWLLVLSHGSSFRPFSKSSRPTNHNIHVYHSQALSGEESSEVGLKAPVLLACPLASSASWHHRRSDPVQQSCEAYTSFMWLCAYWVALQLVP